LFGEADRAGLSYAFQPCGDIDAVAHQITVAFLDDVTEMDADAELNPPVLSHAGIALDQAVLHLDRAAHRVDNAAKLDEAAVAGAVDDPPMVCGNRRIDQIAAQRPEPRERSLLVGTRESAIADNIGDQDRSDFRVSAMAPASGLGHAIMNGASALSHGASGRRQRQQINSLFHKLYLPIFFEHLRNSRRGPQLQKNEPKRLKSLRRAQNCSP
jgi:hypothetical protein